MLTSEKTSSCARAEADLAVALEEGVKVSEAPSGKKRKPLITE